MCNDSREHISGCLSPQILDLQLCFHQWVISLFSSPKINYLLYMAHSLVQNDEKALILPSRKLCFISLFTWVTGLRSVKMIFFFFCFCIWCTWKQEIWQKASRIRKQKWYISIYVYINISNNICTYLYSFIHILFM